MVTVPGSLNSEMGCAGDWTPGCEAAKLTLRADGIWAGTFDLPAGDYEYKVAIDGSVGRSTTARTACRAAQHRAHAPGRRRSPSTSTRAPTSCSRHAEGPIVTLPGSYQNEIGCPGDWAPDCLASLMADGDKDGVYESRPPTSPPVPTRPRSRTA